MRKPSVVNHNCTPPQAEFPQAPFFQEGGLVRKEAWQRQRPFILPVGYQEVPHHHHHAKKLLEYAKIHPPSFLWLSLRSKLVSQNLCHREGSLPPGLILIIFICKRKFQAKNNEQNVWKEARFYHSCNTPPRGLQKISNSQKFQQELEILWGKHATKAPTHMLYHHLTQVEQFFPLCKNQVSQIKIIPRE